MINFSRDPNTTLSMDHAWRILIIEADIIKK